MLTVEEAKEKILEGAEVASDVEEVVTLYAPGRILAEDIVSQIQVPPMDNSQMDGYAVRAAEFADGRRVFSVSQKIFAGHVGTKLENGTCARIFTGAPIPEGADAVIPQEEAVELEDGTVEFKNAPKAGDWIRRAGCDIDIGDTVLRKGDRLTPPALGVAASIGRATVKVYRPIRVSLFFTGDELAMPVKSESKAESTTPTALFCARSCISSAAMSWTTAIFRTLSRIRLKRSARLQENPI